MPTAIATSGLTKYYGKTPGIIDLELEVRTGEVFGFLGPNGAGKSTTIRVLLDFLHVTRGTATILGLDSRRDSLEIRRRVGYLPADLALYPQMTARELFGLLLCGPSSVEADGRIRELSERFALDLDRKISGYSSGMRQKAGIIQAFMHQPELLILDEPTERAGSPDAAGVQRADRRDAGVRTPRCSCRPTCCPRWNGWPTASASSGRAVSLRWRDVETLKERALRHVQLTFPAAGRAGGSSNALAGVRQGDTRARTGCA